MSTLINKGYRKHTEMAADTEASAPPRRTRRGRLLSVKASSIATILIFAMIIGVAVSVLISERRDFIAALTHKGQSLTDFMAHVAPASILSHDITMLYDYVEEVAQDEEVIYAAILRPDGGVIAEHADETGDGGGDHVEISRPIVLGEQVIGAVTIRLSKVLVYERINRMSMAVFVVTFLVLAFAYWRLRLAHDELEREVKNRTGELEAIVYTISHDLKSPVASLRGVAAVFLEDFGRQVGERGRWYVEHMMETTTYLNRMIAGLLTLSQIQRHDQDSEQADALSVVTAILDTLQADFSRRRITVVVSPALAEVVFDQACLNLVFQNLITNAAKFMGDQPVPRIEIGGAVAREGLEVFVRDNGIGIDPAYHESVFLIFRRLEEVSVEGTGIGLAIVKKTVEAYGGRIRIVSQKGRGATFIVRFPRPSLRRKRFWQSKGGSWCRGKKSGSRRSLREGES